MIHRILQDGLCRLERVIGARREARMDVQIVINTVLHGDSLCLLGSIEAEACLDVGTHRLRGGCNMVRMLGVFLQPRLILEFANQHHLRIGARKWSRVHLNFQETRDLLLECLQSPLDLHFRSSAFDFRELILELPKNHMLDHTKKLLNQNKTEQNNGVPKTRPIVPPNRVGVNRINHPKRLARREIIVYSCTQDWNRTMRILQHFLTALCILSMHPCIAELLNTSIFESHVQLEITGYSGGEEALEDFPVLLRFSPERLPGFRYADCAEGGADLRFTDADGVLLASEVDTWNPEGESLVWVRIPRLVGTNTLVTAYWGGDLTSDIFPAVDPRDVWTRYISVWHIREDLRDSAYSANHLARSGNGLLGVEGFLGMGYLQHLGTTQDLHTQRPLKNEEGRALSCFTISGWFCPAASYSMRNARLFSTKIGPEDGYKRNGFELLLSNNRIMMRGDKANETYTYPTGWPDNFAVGRWTHVLGVFDGANARSYFDGTEKGGGGTIAPITGMDHVLGIGNNGGTQGTDNNVFSGGIDEVRIFDGVASDRWIRTEVETMTNEVDFVTAGPVINTLYFPTFRMNPITIEEGIATFQGVLDKVGAADSADVYFACAPLGQPLPPSRRIAQEATLGTILEFTQSGITERTDYQYMFAVTNSAGIGLRAPMIGYFSTHPYRTLTVEKDSHEDPASVTFLLTFGGNMQSTNTLFMVYGAEHGGAGTNGWENCTRVAVIPPGPQTYSITPPEGWGETMQALRFFLVQGRVPDYDVALDYLRTSGAEYFPTTYTPTGASVLEMTIRLRAIHENATLFCSRGNASNDQTFTLFNIGSWNSGQLVGWRRDYHNNTGTPGNRPNENEIYTARMDYAGLTINGVKLQEGSTEPIAFTPPNPVMLMGSYITNPSTGIGNLTKGDFFRFRAWDQGSLSYECIPCIRDGVVGLYETLHSTFIPSPSGIPMPGNESPLLPEHITLLPVATSPIIWVHDDPITTLILMR